jgi:pyrroloquinoline-quinone synthase
MSLQSFRQSQEQFYFAVAHYSQPIACLLSRIKDTKQRTKLLHNLVDEHGDLNESVCHQNTFKTFLASIGSKGIDGLYPSAPVLAFNTALSGACAYEELELGLSCLGIIEYAFADISALIAKQIVERGWVSADVLCHYTLHADLDISHSQDLFSTVEEAWYSPERSIYAEQGLYLGAYIFDQLYRDLYR